MRLPFVLLCVAATSVGSSLLTVAALGARDGAKTAPVAPLPAPAQATPSPATPVARAESDSAKAVEIAPAVAPPAPAPARVEPQVAASDAPPPAPEAAAIAPEPQIIYRDSPPVVIHEREVVHDQPVIIEQPAPTETIVYREVYTGYLGCSEDEVALVPHYRSRYRLVDDDLLVIRFVAGCARVPFEVAIRDYCQPCGYSTQLLISYYHLSPAIFFVDLPASCAAPGVYARPYGFYRQGRCQEAVLSNREYQALLALKVGCDYRRVEPTVVIAQASVSPTPIAAVQRIAPMTRKPPVQAPPEQFVSPTPAPAPIVAPAPTTASRSRTLPPERVIDTSVAPTPAPPTSETKPAVAAPHQASPFTSVAPVAQPQTIAQPAPVEQPAPRVEPGTVAPRDTTVVHEAPRPQAVHAVPPAAAVAPPAPRSLPPEAKPVTQAPVAVERHDAAPVAPPRNAPAPREIAPPVVASDPAPARTAPSPPAAANDQAPTHVAPAPPAATAPVTNDSIRKRNADKREHDQKDGSDR